MRCITFCIVCVLPLLALAAPVPRIAAGHLSKRGLTEAAMEHEISVMPANSITIKDTAEALSSAVEKGKPGQPDSYEESRPGLLQLANYERKKMAAWKLKNPDKIPEDATDTPEMPATRRLMELGAVSPGDKEWNPWLAGILKREEEEAAARDAEKNRKYLRSSSPLPQLPPSRGGALRHSLANSVN